MPHLSPQTLSEAEQRRLRRATAGHPRDHLVFSLALGTGLRLAEIVGLDVGDVFFPDGAPRGRVRLRREIAKRHRAGDVFLPDALAGHRHSGKRSPSHPPETPQPNPRGGLAQSEGRAATESSTSSS
jgi:integrase